MIYLDTAATSLQKPKAVAAACKYATTHYANPSRGGYKASILAEKKAYDTRCLLSRLFSFREEQNIVFTKNATEALNIAIKTLVTRGSRVVISGYEHNAVLRPLVSLGADITVARSPLFAPEKAVSAFESALDLGDIDCVVCTHISNVFGYILPIERIAALCRKRRVPLIIDAAQSAGSLPLNADKLGAHFIAMPGHKGLFGPAGTGVLLCCIPPVSTLVEGGTGTNSKETAMPFFLPDRLEAGTQNMPGIAGLYEGVKFVLDTGIEALSHKAKSLKTIALEGLSSISGVRCYFGTDKTQSAVLSMQLSNIDCVSAAERLAESDICTRAGFHCAFEAHKTARTQKQGTLRMSTSFFNTQKEIQKFLLEMQKIAKNS